MTGKRYKLVVRGEVQGVGFRRLVLSIAARRKLRVEASNLPDGSVEIIVYGLREDAERLASKIENLNVIRVEEVEIRDE